MKKRKVCLAALVSLLSLSVIPIGAHAQNPSGSNAVNGGFGFQVGLTPWSPGGFKWFNGYSRELSDLVWLNAQVNLTMGDMDDDRCWYDERRDRWVCNEGRWDGTAVQFVLGVRLRWELQNVPVVIDCLLGGATDLLFFGYDWAGVAIGFRGGAGVHYFFFDNLGVGPTLNFLLGPAFTERDGVEFFGEFDFQVLGVEYRF